MSDDVKVLEPMNDLSALVAVGMQTEEEQSVRLRAIQLGIASQTCQKISRLHATAVSAMDLAAQCDALYQQKVLEVLPELSMDELKNISDHLTSKAVEVVKLETRLLQGKPLFSDDTLSPEDRKLLRMFGNLKSEEARSKFIAALESSFGSENGMVDVEDASGVVPVETAYDTTVPVGGSYGDVEAFATASVPEAEVVDETHGPLQEAPSEIKLPQPPAIDGFNEDDEFAGM